MHVKKGDQVLVIAGNDKGKQGEIREAYPDANRVIVTGINLRWRHQKPTQQNPKGERLQRESSIHASNVMLFDAKTGKGTRRRAVTASKTGKTDKANKPAKSKAAKSAKN